MLRDDPGIDTDSLAGALAREYGLIANAIAFLPIGYDLNAAVYRVDATDGASYFVKIRFGPLLEAGIEVPLALAGLGIANILAPIRSRSGHSWCRFAQGSDHSVVVYPFIDGSDAVRSGLTARQWREFGATLRAVHQSGLEDRFAEQLTTDAFALPSAALLREMIEVPEERRVESPAAGAFHAFWRAHSERMRSLLGRAEALASTLRAKSFRRVLCHADVHAANILTTEDGRLWLIDWDGPLIAPVERDLLFVVGSNIARRVEPWEEDLFFGGYGPFEIDPDALVYYRYERIIEDLGLMAESILLNPNPSEPARSAEAELATSFFEPGGDIDRAESVARTRWPS